MQLPFKKPKVQPKPAVQPQPEEQQFEKQTKGYGSGGF
jgi:hypothetical protein